ncbi:unnamed protein product [Brassica rapa]|uniref:Uncharacterized protein n=2 Tax=Brassica TaxID=3705 RepID=A0A8D9D5Q1_BRACM|nr:unnamed protein product [Brassica napus]CAG7868548.1 unnamed protein product [Brassica rapa]
MQNKPFKEATEESHFETFPPTFCLVWTSEARRPKQKQKLGFMVIAIRQVINRHQTRVIKFY